MTLTTSGAGRHLIGAGGRGQDEGHDDMKQGKNLTVEMTRNAKIDIDTVGMKGDVLTLPFEAARDLIIANKAVKTDKKPGKAKAKGKADPNGGAKTDAAD